VLKPGILYFRLLIYISANLTFRFCWPKRKRQREGWKGTIIW